MKTALITGVSGQMGSYMSDLLLDKGYSVVGMVRRLSQPNYENIKHILTFRDKPNPNFRLVQGDLTDQDSLLRLISEVKPDEIYNFGAQSHVGVSFQQPELTFNVNALGVQRLLEAARTVANVKVYNAMTSEMFGKAALEYMPQDENTPFMPVSPYGIAKVAAYHIGRYYREAHKMFVVNGISFNTESPRRGPEFVTRKITLGIARIAWGLQEKIELGNLDAKRDWGFAGDYVKAMWASLQQDEPDDYVIATGESKSIRDFLDVAFDEANKMASLGDWRDYNKHYIKFNPLLMRPTDIPELRGDAGRIRRSLGWRPRTTFRGIIKEMVATDIHRVHVEMSLIK